MSGGRIGLELGVCAIVQSDRRDLGIIASQVLGSAMRDRRVVIASRKFVHAFAP